MKVLVVTNGFPPRGRWGTEFYSRELVLGLAARGHQLAVLHPERGAGRPPYSLEELDEGGVRVVLLHDPDDAGRRFAASYADERVEERFAEVLARHRPDVVHFTYLAWGLSVRLPSVARGAGVPSVVTLTDYGLFCHRGQMYDYRLERCFGPHPPEVCARCVREPAPYDAPRARLALKRAAVRALAAVGGLGRVVVARDLAARERAVRGALGDVSAFVAPTRSLARVAQAGGVPAERIVHLPYAFDEAPYREVGRAPLPDVVRFGFLGQFAPHKGLGTLLEAARIVGRERADAAWELVLHGAPSSGRHRLYAPALLAGGPPPRTRVEAPFPPGEAPRVLAGLSSLVVPSSWDENAPLACLQARAAGVFQIGSDVPGIAEVVEEGRHGTLVPPDDPRALARAMVARVDAGTAAGRIAEAGLPVSLDLHLERIEALHREAVAGAAGPQARPEVP